MSARRWTLAIDPGPKESGWVVFDGERVRSYGVEPNREVLKEINSAVMSDDVAYLVIEMPESRGMPVGKEVFDMCVWIGRFVERWIDPDDVMLIKATAVRIALCGTARAKASNVRAALIDRFGPVGSKKRRGPLYGVTGHAWSALAVAVAFADERRR